MAKDLFLTLDLNLLRTFMILSQEKNMRKTSERLFVSQPAISKALQRLRDHFDDELFVKTHHGLKSTEFCEQLIESISPVMHQLSSVINSSTEFEPSELNGTIKIAISPFLLSAVSSKIFLAIREEAPNINLHLLNWSKTSLTELSNDEIQLGINFDIAHAPKELIQKTIAQDSFTAYVRNEHPLNQPSVTPDQCSDYEFATVIAADWNSNLSQTEKIMKMRGHEIKVGFRSELPSAVLDVVRNTDMIFPSSRFVNLNKTPDMRAMKIILDEQEITPNIIAYYHHKNRQSPLTLWLTNKMKSLLVG